jgi:uncharacterized protein (TIGR02996 family)
MTEAGAFMRAIIDRPDDDSPRLIYADWLEENGETERAEFIRLQCARSSARTQTSVRPEAVLREMDLLEHYQAQWTPRIAQLAKSLQASFNRGFIEHVLVEARAFVAGADQLFAQSPVRSVQLIWGAEPPYERARFMQTIAAVPHLARIVALNLTDGFIGSDGAQALAVSEYLGKLEVLRLGGGHIGERGVRALVQAPWFGNLTHLNLANNDVNAGAVHALAVGLETLKAAGRLRLKRIDLAGNPLRTAGFRVIRGSPVLRRLAHMSESVE